MTDYKATTEQWAALRARVEALEAKYETQRLATLEWGQDVDKVKRWSDDHLKRIMKLERNATMTELREASAELTPAPASSLVERVVMAIGRDGETARWSEARAAIREVAAWLREQGVGTSLAVLRPTGLSRRLSVADITTYKLDAAFAPLREFDHLAKPDDFIEVSLWHNGEGFDVNLNSNGEQRFSLTWGMFKALKKLVKELDQ